MLSVLMDIRYALRWFTKRPVYSFALILSLSIGMSLSAMIYSAYDTYFRPLSGEVKNQKELVWLINRDNVSYKLKNVSYRDYLEYRENNTVFSGIAALIYTDSIAYNTKRLMRSGDMAAPVMLHPVSGNYFDVLGIKPVIGRSFSLEDERARRDYALISYRLWKSRFDGDSSVIGKTAFVENIPYTITGVLPRQFDGIDGRLRADIYVISEYFLQNNAYVRERINDGTRPVKLLARLGQGVSLSQASAEMVVRAQHLGTAYPDTNKDLDISVASVSKGDPFGQRVATARDKGILAVMMALFMLIPCVNVASLLLNRALERMYELALRAALGATRMRIIRQLLTELLILNLCGGVMATIVFCLISRVVAVMPSSSWTANFVIDARVIGCAIGFCIAISMLFGLLPILHIIRDDLASRLKSQGTARGHRLRTILICAEFAISLAAIILVAPAAKHYDKDIQSRLSDERILLATFDWGLYNYTDAKISQMKSEMLSRIKSIPGVMTAGFAMAAPYDSMRVIASVYETDGSRLPTGSGYIHSNSIDAGYFRTLNIPIIRGRDITAYDGEAVREVIINKSMAEKYWPNQDVLGKQIIITPTPTFSPHIIVGIAASPHTIVGIAANSALDGAGSAETPAIYSPLSNHRTGVTLIARLMSNEKEIESSVFQAINREIRNIEPQLVVDLRSLERQYDDYIKPRKIFSAVFFSLGMIVFVVAIIGIYAVTSYTINHRMREIGIRMMVGATTGDIVKLLIGSGVKIVAFGTAIGAFLAWIAARGIFMRITDIAAPDIFDYIVVCAILAIITLSTCFIPIIKAVCSDPIKLVKE